MRKNFVTLCLVVTVAIVIMSVPANACYSNLDCGIGGKCIKTGNDMEGVCTDPYGPSEKRGRDRYYEDDSPKNSGSRSKAGKQCYSSMDCGIGGDCIKVNNSMYGTCTD